MMFRNRLKDPKMLIPIGMLFLILASVFRFATRASLSSDLSDAVTGLLYGLSIGCLLLGLKRKNERRRAARDDGPGMRP